MPLAVGIGRVDDVQQQIGLHHFLERGAERRDQAVRQAIDEADRVRQQDLRPVGQPHLAQQRIERDEQRVRDERFLPREAVEERRLAGVGVADQRDGRQQAFAPAIAQLRAARLDVGDLLADDAEAVADVPAIDFELRLTGAAGADAAAEPRQPVARADQPGHEVLELRELDLELAFARARPPREDVEDQLRAIDDREPGFLLEVAQLRGAQLVVDDDEIDVQLGARLRQHPDLAAAQVERGVGRGAFLDETQHDIRPGRAGQTVELFEAVIGGRTGDDAGGETDESRPLPPAAFLAAGHRLSHGQCGRGHVPHEGHLSQEF